MSDTLKYCQCCAFHGAIGRWGLSLNWRNVYYWFNRNYSDTDEREFATPSLESSYYVK